MNRIQPSVEPLRPENRDKPEASDPNPDKPHKQPTHGDNSARRVVETERTIAGRSRKGIIVFAVILGLIGLALVLSGLFAG